MGDISDHISIHEVACKCGCGFIAADYRLVQDLENCCDFFAGEDSKIVRIILHINSWNRCYNYDKDLKTRLGMVFTGKSKHIRGIAVDFWLEAVYTSGLINKIDDDRVADYLEAMYPNSCGIGRYNTRTHFDKRQGYARWDNRTSE